MANLNVTAIIKGIKYEPLLCRNLNLFNVEELDKALSSDATFIVNIDDKNQIALSWWVSSKRTRSYPYARVYDSLSFAGKRATIIPVLKDEGQKGDRDFIQWDTISLMSLLGVYVIIAYYIEAERSPRCKGKITDQRFDVDYIKNKIKNLLSYQSDALHWNLSQIENIGEIVEKAAQAYNRISKEKGIKMHSESSLRKRILKLKKGKDEFMSYSRGLAEKAQKREVVTIQPKEHLDGTKATITITNYLGGKYYLTSDEVWLRDDKIYLVEAKHTKEEKLPSLQDIKDGLLKMILFTNLEDVKIANSKFTSIPVLKLTTAKTLNVENLSKFQQETLKILKEEASKNNFKILLNDKFI
ncbi:MAG: hypothetical protein WC188_07865 [Candidatus Caldatribacteriota bacterium]